MPPRKPRSLSGLFPPILAVLFLLCWGQEAELKGQEFWLAAQEFWRNGNPSVCHRAVQLPAGTVQPRIVVTEFFTQGELRPDGRNLAVYDGRNQVVPWRLLQVGPGDFCRIAIQTVPQQSVYKIYYGGPVPTEEPPPWTSPAGLLLETRRWQTCDLNSLPSVREALKAAELLGSDYVPNVFHRFSPVSPGPEPFLSVYRGTLHVDTPGKHQFFTSSQDCSFLLIDGQQVVASPGAHGPAGDARIKGDATLSAGPHSFEYVHAAAGPDACMAAAWQPPRGAKPETIPATAFGARDVAHLPAGGPLHRSKGGLPDFSVEVVGEVPVVESEVPLTRVRFKDVSPPSVTGNVRVAWDFGDGQVSDKTNPVHVYLRPGLYAVKMTAHRGMGAAESVNRVRIHRAVVLPDPKNQPDQLAEYLPTLDRHDMAKLGPADVLQLVRAYHQAGQTSRAAKIGKGSLLSERTAEGQDEEAVHALARTVGPLLRDSLDDPAGAQEGWRAAVKAVRQELWKAKCEVEAADICLNDLLQRAEAKGLLDSATRRLARTNDPALLSRLHRVWGDWYARGGDKEAARAAYGRAMTAQGSRRTEVEQNAWRGAFSRSTEAFLREKDLDRVLEELRHWQDQFPADKIDGHLSLLQARYWAARGKLPQAVAVASDLVAVNPDSPYADQLTYLAAECDEKLGRIERALAGYQALVTDYPGSPLVKDAKQKLAQLPAIKAPEPKKQ